MDTAPDPYAGLPPAMIETAVAAADWIIILPVLLGMLGAALMVMLRRSQPWQMPFSLLVVGAILVCDLQLFGRVLQTGPFTMTMGKWLPPFGISFTAEMLGVGFALAAAVVTLVVLAYAQVDTREAEQRKGFYPLVLLMLAGVHGAFLTGDFFNLYVWFEVILISSFGLMVLSGREQVLDAAVKYGILNFVGTTLFLLALGFLNGILGTLNMADIAMRSPDAPAGPMLAVAALLLLAFGIKSAAFPVNAWLPASYHTPPAAISALFAGLLTKVGVYALLKSLVLLLPGSLGALQPLIAVIAIATLIVAPLGAIAETNLRRALGFLVIGGIGAVLMGLALGNLRGIAGAAAYGAYAMFAMAAFYLVAGLVEKITGTHDTRGMGGLYATNPILAILFLALVFVAAGTPPLLGFWPKLILVEAAWEQSGIAQDGAVFDGLALAMLVALLLNALLTLIAGTRLWAHVFWRSGREGAMSELHNDRLRHLTSRERWLALLPTGALVGFIALLGLMPNLFIDASRIAASDLLAPERYIQSVGLAPDTRATAQEEPGEVQ